MSSPSHPGAAPPARRAGFRIGALAGVAVLVLGACSPAAPSGAPSSQSPAADVTIAGFRFAPARLTVRAGTTIRWTNGGHLEDVVHSVDFPGGGVDSRVLHHGDRFVHAFTAPGTYDYLCRIHPFMHGAVVVTP
jgi:plastocyanin